jgi:hypothetical protein
VSDRGEITSRQEHSAPSEPRTESWGGRILSWVYPGRGWAGGQVVIDPERASSPVKLRPTPGRPEGYRAVKR